MKLNKKGMTLVELLVAIVFIGIILVFMFNLLSDLKNETGNNYFAYNNQVNKIDAIHTIQKDLNKYMLLGIEDQSNSNINIKFHYMRGNDEKIATLSSKKESNKYYLNYTDVEGVPYSWQMKNAELDLCGKFTIYNETKEENELKNYYFKMIFNIYNKQYSERNNKSNNNVIDDIEISYSGYNNDLASNSSYLTSKNNGTYNIGKC